MGVRVEVFRDSEKLPTNQKIESASSRTVSLCSDRVDRVPFRALHFLPSTEFQVWRGSE